MENNRVKHSDSEWNRRRKNKELPGTAEESEHETFHFWT